MVISENKAVKRKLKSTMLETVRVCVKQKKQEWEDVEKEIGYEYLKVVRRCPENFVFSLLQLIVRMMRKEEDILLQRHSKKWTSLTDHTYPIVPLSYVCEHKPVFPFPYNDNFWCVRVDRPVTRTMRLTNFTNDSEHIIPAHINQVLSKGPKFRVPPKLNAKFTDRAKIDLETLTYNLRWKNVFESQDNDNSVIVPFHKNTVKLPPKMKNSDEEKLALFKSEALRVIEKEMTKTKNSNKYKNIQKDIDKTKKFMKDRDLAVVQSDKTNRIVVTNQQKYKESTEEMLQDQNTYKLLRKSKSKSLEKQANNIIRSVCRGTAFEPDIPKLLTNGSKPAHFSTLIKDHKEKTEKHFPLRPIASVHGTPTEKVDWLVSKILNQFLQFVPAHLKNSSDLIDCFASIDKTKLNPRQMFLSLDVVQLYPSIPISEGITAIIEMAKTNWDKIDTKGLTIQDLEKCIKFISYNYEIEYNDKTYLQIRGCPMGAHYSPLFAIIYMNSVEEKALQVLKQDHGIEPLLYKRYVDDVIMGPFDTLDLSATNKITKVFNSIDESIQFTVEVPGVDRKLSFLDISIYLSEDGISYDWFQKSCHSGNTLRIDSWVPQHIKSNFVKNVTSDVKRKCSSMESRHEAIGKLDKQLYANGHKPQHGNKNKKRTNKRNPNDSFNLAIWKCDFINDRCNRKLKCLIKKYDLPVRFINKQSKNLSQRLKDNFKKSCDCEVCQRLRNSFKCTDKFTVYKFTCKFCHKFYIGQTARPLYQRFNEHKRSLNAKNDQSALSDHSKKDHHSNLTIIDFEFDVMYKGNNPVEARIAEAKLISEHCPSLNRREELTRW